MPDNLLLSSIAPDALAAIQPQLERVNVRLHQVLVEPDQAIGYVYFPLTCMISLVTVLENGSTIESATVGNEGISGLSLFHGLSSSTSRALVQMDGDALRMKAADFKTALQHHPSLVTAIGRYADALISMLAQSGACNGGHAVEQRFARWLLTIADRVDRLEFTITQEFLAQMLGTHRPTVTIAAGSLQTAGIIKYSHGHVTILNRELLEEVACECYQIIRDLYFGTFRRTFDPVG